MRRSKREPVAITYNISGLVGKDAAETARRVAAALKDYERRYGSVSGSHARPPVLPRSVPDSARDDHPERALAYLLIASVVVFAALTAWVVTR